jgi:hypothetical protein
MMLKKHTCHTDLGGAQECRQWGSTRPNQFEAMNTLILFDEQPMQCKAPTSCQSFLQKMHAQMAQQTYMRNAACVASLPEEHVEDLFWVEVIWPTVVVLRSAGPAPGA